MRLREIEPGMVIHCKTMKEADALCNNLGVSSQWKRYWDEYKEETCYEISKGGKLVYYGQMSTFKEKRITEFSDLIIPDLSPAEVLKICNEICREETPCNDCKMAGNCFFEKDSDYQKVVEICEQWKADHEKKEPEFEWVFDCFQNSNINSAIPSIVVEKEEEAKKHCEDMAKKYPGETFAYISVCRVKQ